MLRAFTSLAGALIVAAAANAGDMRVVIDQSEILRLARPAASIVIGNPSVAGVSIENTTTLVVTGRAYGATTLMALDGRGQPIFAGEVVVSERPGGALTLVRGNLTGQLSYVCAPRCARVPDIGDNKTEFDNAQSQADARAAGAKAGQ